MSRLGSKPLPIPEKVKAEFKNHSVEIQGPLGKLSLAVNRNLDVKIENNQILVINKGTDRQDNMLHGLTRGLIKNLLDGVTHGFKKDLEIHGLGFKASIEANKLVMHLGFSHPVTFEVPKGIKVTVDKLNLLSVSGIDKYMVGQTAASIRAFRKPEPYKGTGIRYVGEHIIKKAGKAAAVGAAGGVSTAKK
jgi:large subunit ribosomal protein L6